MTAETITTMTQSEKDTSNKKDTKTKDKESAPTKIVVRRLPPTLTAETFIEQVSPIPDHDYLDFVPADLEMGVAAFTRVYINFLNSEDVFIFTEKFDNYVFVDSKGNEYPAIVEYAPYQKIPKKKVKKTDSRKGTIDDDSDYIKFKEAHENPGPSESTFSPENILEEIESREKELKANHGVLKVSTPLLDYIKKKKEEKKQANIKLRDDRKKREEERRIKREEERKKKRDRERERLREKEKERHDRQKGVREKDRDRGDNRNRRNDRDKDNFRDRDRDRDKDSFRDRDRDKDNFRDRDRDKDNFRDRNRDKDSFRGDRDKDNFRGDRDKDNFRGDRDKDRDRRKQESSSPMKLLGKSEKEDVGGSSGRDESDRDRKPDTRPKQIDYRMKDRSFDSSNKENSRDADRRKERDERERRRREREDEEERKWRERERERREKRDRDRKDREKKERERRERDRERREKEKKQREMEEKERECSEEKSTSDAVSEPVSSKSLDKPKDPMIESTSSIEEQPSSSNEGKDADKKGQRQRALRYKDRPERQIYNPGQRAAERRKQMESRRPEDVKSDSADSKGQGDIESGRRGSAGSNHSPRDG